MDIRTAVILLLVFIIKPVMNKEEPFSCEDVICPHFLDPVCGLFDTFLIEFPNRCEFEMHGCKKQKQGKVVRLGPCPDWRVFD